MSNCTCLGFGFNRSCPVHGNPLLIKELEKKLAERDQRIESLQKDNQLMREGLEFYATKSHYHDLVDYKGVHNYTEIGYADQLGADDGKKARAVLAQVKGDER